MPWYRAFHTLRIESGEWRARDPTQFALAESMLRDVALLFAGASFGGVFPTHRGDVPDPFWDPVRRDDRPASPYRGLDEPFPEANPPLTFSVACKHHPSAPVREDSSPRAPLPVVRFSPASQNRLTYAR